MNIVNSNNHLSVLARYDPNKIINNKKALILLDISFFTFNNNVENKVIDNYLKQHQCILWSIKGSYDRDETIRTVPYIKGQIIGLVDNAKNMSYLRYLIRSEKELLTLPSILIDYDLQQYNYTGFDLTIDLQNYVVSGFVKNINYRKIFDDIDTFLQLWYNYDAQFNTAIANGIILKNNCKMMDYKF